MQYQIYVHREGDASFCGNFPDSPRAVGRGKAASHAPQGIGIQLSLLQQVDLAARERHMTRSALITLALVHELAARYEGQLSCVPVSQSGFVDR